MQSLKRKLPVYLSLIILLVCFFTFVSAAEFFSDGFEANDFSAWTDVSAGADVTLEIQSNIVNSGSYATHVVLPASHVTETAFAYKNLNAANQKTVYMRAYFYFTDISLSASANRYFALMSLIGTTGASTSYQYLQLRLGGTTGLLRLYYRTTAGYQSDTSATALSTGEWYCLELVFIEESSEGAGDGEVRCYLNDVEVADLTNTGLNNLVWSGIDSVQAGSNSGYLDEAATHGEYYIDDVEVSDSYVGPIEEGYTEESVSLVLNTPANESTVSEYAQNMNYTPTLIGSDSFFNATLYVNGSPVAYNQTAIMNATLNTINYVFPGQNATYLWGIQVWNSTTPVFSSNGNFTLTVAVYEPDPTPTPSPTPAGTLTTDEVLGVCIVLIIVFMCIPIALVVSRKRKDG